jgi:hypothetical protein
MSDETTFSPGNSPDPSPESAPRVRRISNPRPKKLAKTEAPVAIETPVEIQAPVLAEIPSIPFPSARKREPRAEAPAPAGNDWPESEDAATGDAPSQTESSKRKRRRRKGKGQSNGQQNTAEPSNEEVHSLAAAEPMSAEPAQDQRPRPQATAQSQPHPQQQRSKIDPELLTKMAWKIYLAEVSEEGVALIGDSDAKDLSRRCFRLAEIFIEEQSRRR